MTEGACKMSVRHTGVQFQDDGELEQALATVEDARDEATRLAHELDAVRLLLAQREQEISSLHAEIERRDIEANAPSKKWRIICSTVRRRMRF